MRKRFTAMLVTMIPFGLAPAAAIAAGCGDYPLTQAQAFYLGTTVPDIQIPEGEVPFVQRCDVDGNGKVDNDDLFIIRAHRGEPAAHPDDPMDWDGNGVIHGRDVGGCASSCTSNGCAVKEDNAEEEGLEAALAEGATALPGESASCFQVGDIDGDNVEDFVGIFEYTGGAQRGGNWNLNTVILFQDGAGNVQHLEFPYSGRLAEGSGDLRQHLSLQPAGTVDLNPGSVTLTEPGVVSYRDGEPKTIYYLNNGTLTQAFFGIDD